MAAANAVTSSSISTSRLLIRRNSRSRVSKVFFSSSPTCSSSPERTPPLVRGNYTGVRLAETVELSLEKTRVDSWISSRIPGISRARVQSSIRSGLVTVNGGIIFKVSHIIKGGDKVSCIVCELEPLKAEPEEIPLNIVYEDEHVLVVNKPAHMVVHPAPGNANGTLVNAILNHCQLPAGARIINRKNFLETEDNDSSDNEVGYFYVGHGSDSLVRPGIVHRLDKGTSGLLVVAKIRAHARYLGIPLLGDDLYGGTKGMALSLLKSRTPVSSHALVSEMVSTLERPCLHAQSLGFKHPHTGEHLHFSCPPPDDFARILHRLRSFSGHQSKSDSGLDLQ